MIQFSARSMVVLGCVLAVTAPVAAGRRGGGHGGGVRHAGGGHVGGFAAPARFSAFRPAPVYAGGRYTGVAGYRFGAAGYRPGYRGYRSGYSGYGFGYLGYGSAY